MDIWHIRGGRKLEGSCHVQGSKNASLPILAASIVSPARTELKNVPQLKDVDAALRILRHLGCSVQQNNNDVSIDSTGFSCCSIPHSLMEEMRSSVFFMGAMLARCGEARLSLPGGCQLGRRPIDLHLSALRKMGVDIEEEGQELHCRSGKLHGAEIQLPFPSVGATENIMLAACSAKGCTLIRGAAREPEITALQDYLNALGAEISGAGSDTIVISGFTPREQAVCRIIPDRIVAATLACAVAATGGDLKLCGVIPAHFSTVLYFLKQAGCDIIHKNRSVSIRVQQRLKAPGLIVTQPYPGFPTDAQPVLMAALLQAEGRSTMIENIFESRYRQAEELRRLGADITVKGREAVINGVESLQGTALRATDLRGGAAMLVAGLAAEGETLVFDKGHIRRGYEQFDKRLREIGADIVLEY